MTEPLHERWEREAASWARWVRTPGHAGRQRVSELEIERRRRGWKIVQVQADGRRSFLTEDRMTSPRPR
jgi:hypothetical protein